jgi:SAM-dependent methyltransferase
MTPEERAARARSFGAIAEHYDRYRPGPPAEAVDWLLGGRVTTAVDVGAGTGALTRLLVERAEQVYAVEPDARMAAVLHERVPGADVREGRAEAIPLPDASTDAVVGASMWHWVDEARGATEIARILRPGGVFGLLWSGADRSHEWIGGLLSQANPRRDPREAHDDSRRRRHEVHLPEPAPFAPPESRLFRWTMAITLDELAGLAGTYSIVIRLPESERAGLHDRMRAYLRDHPPPPSVQTGDDRIDLPMRCYCWRTHRLPATAAPRPRDPR